MTRGSRRGIAAIVAMAWVSGGGVPEARAWDLATGVAATYDDNILNYSERDLFAFRYRLNPARYGLETTDDLILSQYLELGLDSESSRSSSFLARFATNHYLSNRIRNNLDCQLQGRVWPSPRWRVTLAASYLPSYYARRYVDNSVSVPYPQLSRYRDARYGQAGASGGAEWRPIRAWRAQLGYDYRRRNFQRGFSERDEDRHTLRLSLRPPRRFGIGSRWRGSYGRTLARGRDELESGGTGSVPDVSTRSLGGGLVLEWTARSREPSITLQQAVDYERRRYTTADTSDTQRFGRSIRELDLDWDVAVGFAGHWQASAGYGLVTQRLSGSLSNVETFTDAGSYNRNRMSLRLSWASREHTTHSGETE